jgi:divalent metal cation (Fe/Co/Zn/Cd) transporter
MTTQSGDMRGLVLALVTYILIFAIKLGAYFVTGVMVLLAEALDLLGCQEQDAAND